MYIYIYIIVCYKFSATPFVNAVRITIPPQEEVAAGRDRSMEDLKTNLFISQINFRVHLSIYSIYNVYAVWDDGTDHVLFRVIR